MSVDTKINDSRDELRSISRVAGKRFVAYYKPDKLQRRVHNHDTHRDEEKPISELEKQALSFIMDRCGAISTDTLKVNDQLLTLYHAIHRFMETGSREDAFDVYYTYVSRYIKDYKKARRMLEVLSNFETNASSLLMSHRDHYSHSVYVFIIGLAIYNTNKAFRASVQRTYQGLSDEQFLQFWGLASLFHDVGYPFEIPFMQIKDYLSDFEGKDEEKPFVSYKNMAGMINAEKVVKSCFEDRNEELTAEDIHNILKELMGDKYKEAMKDKTGKVKCPETVEEIIGWHIAKRLQSRKYPDARYNDKYGYKYICECIHSKPETPDNNNYFMDHAYFSGVITFCKMLQMVGINEILGNNSQDLDKWMDAMTAITLHNSLFKFRLRTVVNEKKEQMEERPFIEKPLQMDEHPLAYLLMLCDELQCWDRTSYGINSKKQIHAIDCEFEFTEDQVTANYIFEKSNDYLKFDENGNIKSVSDGTLAKFYTFYKSAKDESGKKKKVIYNPGNMSKPDSPDTWQVLPENCCGIKFYQDIAEIVDVMELSGKEISYFRVLDEYDKLLNEADWNKSHVVPYELVNKSWEYDGFRVGMKLDSNNRYRNDSFSNVELMKLYALAAYVWYESTGKDIESENKDTILTEFDAIDVTEKISYMGCIKSVAASFDRIGCFYTDTPKNYSRKRKDDFTLSERKMLAQWERDRQKDEQNYMCGPFCMPVKDEIDTDYGANAEMYRMMLDYENKIAAGGGFIKIDAEELIAIILKVVDKKLLVYNNPNKLTYELVYPEKYRPDDIDIETLADVLRGKSPELVLAKDMHGDIVRVYSKNDFIYDTDRELVFCKDAMQRFKKNSQRPSDDGDEYTEYIFNLSKDSDYPRLRYTAGEYDIYDRCFSSEELVYENSEYEGQYVDDSMFYLGKTYDEENEEIILADEIYYKRSLAGCVSVVDCLNSQKNDLDRLFLNDRDIEAYNASKA